MIFREYLKRRASLLLLDFKWIIKNNLLAPHNSLHHIHNFINNFTTQLLDPWENKILPRLLESSHLRINLIIIILRHFIDEKMLSAWITHVDYDHREHLPQEQAQQRTIFFSELWSVENCRQSSTKSNTCNLSF